MFFGLTRVATAATRIAQLDFTAPSNGYVFTTATGYCNHGTAPSNIRLQIGTSPAALFFGTDDLAAMSITEATAGAANQSPFAMTRSIAVLAGANSLYVNAYQPIGNSNPTCTGTFTVMFAPTLLP
jgi:hypothetical protein